MVALAALTALSFTGVARAGLKSSAAVSILPAFGYASGSIGSARNSTNTTEQIGCQTNGQADYGLIECFATDASGNSAYCWVEDSSPPDGMQQGSLPLMGDASYIAFAWNAQGQCTSILVSVSSDNEPKRP